MPLSALLLALAAAVLHALWNLLIARARDPEAATAVALIAAAIAFAPVAALTWDVDADAWPYIVASATLELAYFALLAAAYRRSELGLVYPLARGLAPVLVLVAAAAVLGTDPSLGEVVGVAAITVGVFLVRGIGRSADRRGTLFAVVIAGCIAAYTLVDKAGMQHAAPLPYLELVLAGPALVYAAGLTSARGRPAVRAEVGLPAIAAGLAMFGASSVVLATVLAARVLHERVTPARLAGSIVVAGGVAVLALS